MNKEALIDFIANRLKEIPTHRLMALVEAVSHAKPQWDRHGSEATVTFGWEAWHTLQDMFDLPTERKVFTSFGIVFLSPDSETGLIIAKSNALFDPRLKKEFRAVLLFDKDGDFTGYSSTHSNALTALQLVGIVQRLQEEISKQLKESEVR